MKAFRLVAWGQPPEFVDVARPEPGPGEVLVAMRGAGLCRSDLDVMDQTPGSQPFAAVIGDGFTLGHENAGLVAGCGAGVIDLAEGEAVVVHHVRSCGHCGFCLDGVEQACQTFARGAVTLTRGIGLDGGLAEYMVVPRHELVKLGALSPEESAPLTDAGVTAYRAVRSALHCLKPGSTALVIGLGGLGFYGVQFLRLLTAARIIGTDRVPERLKLAQLAGADAVFLSDADSRDRIMDLTSGKGADVILDFVGNDATLALAAAVSRPMGRIVLVGLGGGTMPVGWGHMATGAEFAISLGSSRSDLAEVCALAAGGKLRHEVERFAFDDVALAYERMRAGTLSGRAVITFD
jgi:alcohol dehydrogenase, propanol-preferring